MIYGCYYSLNKKPKLENISPDAFDETAFIMQLDKNAAAELGETILKNHPPKGATVPANGKDRVLHDIFAVSGEQWKDFRNELLNTLSVLAKKHPGAVNDFTRLSTALGKLETGL